MIKTAKPAKEIKFVIEDMGEIEPPMDEPGFCIHQIFRDDKLCFLGFTTRERAEKWIAENNPKLQVITLDNPTVLPNYLSNFHGERWGVCIDDEISLPVSDYLANH